MYLPNIKTFFIHSKYYKNYKKIPDNAFLKYENIKIYHKESKRKLNDEIKFLLVDFIHQFFIYNVDDKYLEDYILFLIEKYTFDEIKNEILNLNDDLIERIYNLGAIKLLIDEKIQNDEFICDNCSPEYYIQNKIDKNKLKNNTRMQEFFKRVKRYDQILKAKSKLKCDSDKYLNRFMDVNSALICASRYGNIKYVKFLIEKGACIQKGINNSLYPACKNGHFKIVKMLVEKRAIIDDFDNIAFKISCKKGYTKIMKYLIEKGSNIRGYHECVLACLSEHGNIEIIKYLIEKYTLKYHDFDRGFRTACRNGNLEIVKLLIKYIDKSTLDHSLYISKLLNQSEIIDFLVKNGNYDIISFLV
jgi:ankyrin repeat protein